MLAGSLAVLAALAGSLAALATFLLAALAFFAFLAVLAALTVFHFIYYLAIFYEKFGEGIKMIKNAATLLNQSHVFQFRD